MPITYHSKICEIAYGAMANLFAAGLIDAHRMMEFDLLCVSDHPARHADGTAPPQAAAPQPLQIENAGAPAAAATPSALPAATAQPSPSRAPLSPPMAASAMQRAAQQTGPSLQTATALRALREREGVSAAVFARHLDVQPQAVIAWEAGFAQPSASVARLLEIVAEKGLLAIH
jgi:DNA-binding transcriptional regulator YiaG